MKKTNIDWIFKQEKAVKKVLQPKVEYFPDVDILYIWFGGKDKINSSVEVEDILFDFRKDGLILGLEIQGASSYFKRKPKVRRRGK